MQFDRVCMLASNATHDEVLEHLKSCAVLVRGLWVALSKNVHPESERHELFRDFVLLQFRKHAMITRKDLSDISVLPPAAVRTLLAGMAVLKPANGWMLKHEQDDVFCARYPEVVEEQERMWDERAPMIMEHLKQLAATKARSKRTPKSTK